MKYSGFENSEQILGEINGVPAGGRGSCQIFYPQDLAHRMYRHFDIFIKNATSEINNNFCSILKISGWSEVKRLGRGVQVEQGHQLPSQPARCREVGFWDKQSKNINHIDVEDRNALPYFPPTSPAVQSLATLRWVDLYGESVISCAATGLSARIQFVKASYWSSKRSDAFPFIINCSPKLCLLS